MLGKATSSPPQEYLRAQRPTCRRALRSAYPTTTSSSPSTTPPQHQLSMSCLKETVLVTTSGLSRSVSRMSQRGWVTKETSPEDRRKVSLALTPEGLAAIEAIRPHHHEYVREHFFDALSAKDQQALGLALAHLSDHLTS